MKSTFSIHKSTIRATVPVRPALVAAEYSSRRGLELEYSRPDPSVFVNIHAPGRRGSITARPPGGVPGVVHCRDTPPAAAPRKSAPAGSEYRPGRYTGRLLPARSVARCSVERASVVVPSSRPCRHGANDGGHDPEQAENEQVGHGASLCGPTIPDARHPHRRVRDER